MELEPGAKLGPYEIVAAIGRGGMGEVWKARDARLNRDVAIKTSRLGFSGRFQKEAQAIAALNHPNICTVFDVGPDYLVMEFIEGSTLAERIAQGPLDLEEALGIAKQIGDALEAAHDKAIVHRDLKPANVKIRPDGSVKVLDFGLAKAGEAADVTGDSPTLLTVGTQTGMILGTAGYMSPEQARGQVADKRADVWAFGVVLWEMLAGRRLFDGATVTDSLAAILKEEPDLTAAPVKVRRLLGRCLEKDPKKRLRGIGDWRELLVEEEQTAAAPRSNSRWGVGWGVAAAGIFAVLLAILAFVHFREVPEQQPLQEFEITTGTPAVFVAISPDGKQMAFVREDGGIRHLYLRALDSVETHLAPDSDGATYPFWSPDSRNVAYFAGGKLRKFAPGSKLAFTICDVANARGGAWGGDNTIIFGDQQRPLYRVAASGGSPVAMTDGRLPAFLPGGRRFLFNANGGLQLGSLDGGNPAATGLKATDVAFVPFTRNRGFVLGWANEAVLAWPFDSGAGRASGEPVVVAEQVGRGPQNATGVYSASQNGILVYSRGGRVSEGQLRWVSRAGERLEAVGKPGPLWSFAAAPDGRRIAETRQDSNSASVWMDDVASGATSRFSEGTGESGNAVWSPDGQSVVYATPTGRGALFHRRSAGGGRDETLGGFGSNAAPAAISPDGKYLVYSATGAGTRDDLWMMALEGEKKPVILLQTPAAELRAQFSPDGRWLSYESDQTGRPEIYVQPMPPDGSRTQLSTEGGTRAKWRGDGKELYYIAPGGKVMAVAVNARKTLEHGPPRELFTAEGLGDVASRGFPYQPSPDGQRFLAILPAQGQEAPATLTVVVNWMAGLKGPK